ncbi:hypothetical protein VC83_02607 [Pseudogymnoascus destructans]|uniref:TATA element modulatory factor 1 TATA binding domain-containing protein n=2 Tax=Pseudogymnoascus destructans TaxID=655981 RepID=L8G429_PSED2|nr:uncharacterized protein VC83_02607 [Pseudogymnoascus destructans]ELR08030.1 hypothetical protein GMDG_02868 [Pseudogymnoascus destructans 20631-21]OAF60787.1 hypothetical protein VC83_02607 [Pseudogymnoascus destructans]
MATSGKQSSRWGSFLSQAVAGIESNLDNILSGDDVPQAKPVAVVPPAALKVENAPSRSSSSNPASNDRLQERLARAVAAKKIAAQNGGAQTPTSNSSSRVGSPAPASDTPGPSLDVVARASEEGGSGTQADADTDEKVVPQLNIESADTDKEAQAEGRPSGDLGSKTTGDTARLSTDSAPARRSTESQSATGPKAKTNGNTTVDEPTTTDKRPVADADREEEIHGYIERIDALQVKLQYLARESSENARKAAAAAPADSFEKKLADKDQQIALLMEEGQKLSNTELKHMTVIKKLQVKGFESEKAAGEVNNTLEKMVKEKATLNERLKRADGIERQLNERHKQVSRTQKDMEAVKAERDAKEVQIGQLKAQLSESASQAKADEVKKIQGQLDAEKKRASNLDEEVSSLKIEKKLAEDKLRAQIEELQSKAERGADRARAAELEQKGEIQLLESRLEVMRTRAEEISSGATGDAQAKFLRQIETLQTQYSIASENWQGIQTSLTSQVTNLQKERDEAFRRESDIRKKAREMTLRAKSNEDEAESLQTQINELQQAVTSQKTQLVQLQQKVDEAEAALQKANNAFELEKQTWASELQQRLEEERNKWKEEAPRSAYNFDRAVSPVASSRMGLTAEYLGLQNLQTRRAGSSRDMLDDLPGVERRMSRPSSSRLPRSSGHVTPKRQDSATLFSPDAEASDAPPITMDPDEYLENTASPVDHHHTMNDIMSVSTAGAGPSVQLVERMSAAVRRLENEKISTKEELVRLASQRDEARAEIVSLMQEVEAKRADHNRVLELEKEVDAINARYQTTLEMLGEKSEMVEELKADVQDVKAMYRELVENTVK